MRLVTDSGLWSTGQALAHPELTAVLEVSGAVLSWTVDDPSTTAQITFTDPTRADWLWRRSAKGESSGLWSAGRPARLNGATAVLVQLEPHGLGKRPLLSVKAV